MENLKHLSDNPKLQKQMHQELLINWVNSFHHYSHCGSALDLSDFADGVIFCELVYDLIIKGRDASFLRKVATSNLDENRSIQNISLALSQIRDPSFTLPSPKQIYSDINERIKVLDYLYSIRQTTEKLSPSERGVGKPPLSGRNRDQNQSIGKDKVNSQGKDSMSSQEIQSMNSQERENQDGIIKRQQNNNYRNGTGYSQNRNQYSNGDDLLDPENETDPMESPYEVEEGFEREQQQQQQFYRPKSYSERGQITKESEEDEAEIERKAALFASNQMIQENIQKMSQSLGEHFRNKSENHKGQSEIFFNANDKEQNDQSNNGEDVPKGSASMTKFYQMSKMRPGQKSYQAQVIEVAGEISQAQRDKEYAKNQENQDVLHLDVIPEQDIQSADEHGKESFNRETFGSNQSRPNLVQLQETIQMQAQESMARLRQFKEKTKQNEKAQNEQDNNRNQRFQLSEQAKQHYLENKMRQGQQVTPSKNQEVREIEDEEVRRSIRSDDQLQQVWKASETKNNQGKDTKMYRNEKLNISKDTQRSKESLRLKDNNSPHSQSNSSKSPVYKEIRSPQVKNSFVVKQVNNQRDHSAKKLEEAREFMDEVERNEKKKEVNLKKILRGEDENENLYYNHTSSYSDTNNNFNDKINLRDDMPVLEFEIEGVGMKTREKLLDWLGEIKLLKIIPQLETKLHKICKDGVIFADIINLMSGKNEVIRGLERKPTSKTQVSANYSKIFAQLRKFDKMNPRFLSQDKLIQEDEHIFWGFLDDLYYFFSNKISPYDVRFNKLAYQNRQQQQQSQQQPSQTQSEKNLQSYMQQSQISQQSFTQQSKSVRPPSSQLFKSPNFSGLGKIQEESGEVHSFQQSSRRSNPNLANNQNITNTNSITNTNKQKYEDIMHSSHNESKLKIQREIKQQERANSKDLSSSHRILTEDGSPTRYKEDDDEDIINQEELNESFRVIDVDNVKQWLRQLGFNYQLKKSANLFKNKENSQSNNAEANDNNKVQQKNKEEANLSTIIDDPIRNGTLICLILSRIEMCRVDQMYRKPTSLEECRKNFDLAYKNIRARTVQVGIDLLWKDKEIMYDGNFESLWQLLHGLMISTNNSQRTPGVGRFQSFSSNRLASPSNQDKIAKQINQNSQQQPPLLDSMVLPYSIGALHNLKQCLMQFVNNMNIYFELGIDEPKNFQEFIDICRNGAVLCLVISQVVQIKIVGINRKCCTKITALANIRKFLEIFRRTKGLPTIFQVSDEAIYDRKEHLIIALLEELLRLKYQAPQRQQDSVSDQPFLVNFPQILPIISQQEQQQSIQYLQDDIFEEKDQNSAASSPSRKPRLSLNDGISKKDLLKSYTDGFASQSSIQGVGSPKETDTLNKQSTSNKSKSNAENKEMGLSMAVNRSSFLRIEDPFNASIQSNKMDTSSTKKQNTTDYSNSKKQNINDSSAAKITQVDKQLEEIALAEEEGIPDEYSERIKSWLSQIGFEDLALNLNFAEPEIIALKDGTALCKLISKLEGRDITGIHEKPRTQAQSRHNLKKCIEVLERKNEMEIKLLWDEDLIFECSAPFMKKFLLAIQRAYRKQYRSLQKRQQHFQI